MRADATVSAAGVLTLSGPAFAAGSYTVTAGGQSTGTTAFTGTSDDVQFSTSVGIVLACGSSSVGGVLHLGTSDGSDVASIERSRFDDCVGPLGIPLEFTHVGSWSLSATSTRADGKIVKRGSGVAVHVSNPDGQCDFDVTGSADGVIDEDAQQFTATAGNVLTINDVSGCFGLVIDGDTVDLAVPYDISTAAGPFAITES